MSIDELNNQHEEKRGLVSSANANNDTLNRNYISYRNQGIATVSEQSGSKLPLSSQELKALHRVRINRMLMRKRRQGRASKDMVPRIVTTTVIILAVLTLLVSGSVGAGYAYYQTQLPLLNGIAQHSLFQTTRIYDRNGTLLYELYDHQQDKGRRTYINYNDISPFLVNATVAAEDRTFWTNNGVDFNGIIRAAFSNAQSNQVVEGGSTVTQQLIKKEFFDGQNRTVQLKAEEALLATGLTQQYPKWKIMEMYLNTVYYGDLNYSAEAAAQDFFGLQPKCTHTICKAAVGQLDLAQASMLAGLPQGPSLYDPIVNKPEALARQKIVLQAMLTMGVINAKQVTQAEQEMAKYTFTSHSINNASLAPHFVHYVIDELVPLIGAQALEDGGYSIYTTLDLTLEKKVEQIVYDHLYTPTYDQYLPFAQYGSLYQTHNVNNGAAVVMNPYNGEILAMDGSAKYGMNTPTVRGEDNAAMALRQPGSSFKPIVYATDFEMGWYPGMIVPDHKTTYPVKADTGGYYQPQNYDQTFHTTFPMTIRTAVANSYNIPAIDGLMYAGIGNVQNMAGRLGLNEIANLLPTQTGPSMAIGSKEVTLLDMTSAYSTFANKGVHVPPTSILEITNNEGQAIYKYDEAHPQGKRALREDVSFLISSVLSDKTARYHEFSQGNPLELDRPAAAKTGTTDSFRDNWTMGYTPYLTVGTWAGNSDNSIMKGAIGITGAAPIWHDIMEYASQRYHFPPDDFTKPADVHAGTISAITGLLPHPGEPTVTDWFIDGTMPTMMSNYVNNPQKNCNKRRGCQQPGTGAGQIFPGPIIAGN
ncbi:MAG TPA: transglycosylase domain-containing protein [Ktedonobacteraceae bacterium]